MLEEYFGLVVTKNGLITTLPMVMNHYIPNMVKLPDFCLELTTQVAFFRLLYNMYRLFIEFLISDKLERRERMLNWDIESD
jgi:hypothetical protein